MATAAQALSQITNGMTVAQLRALANTVDASVGNSTLLLYSGGVGSDVGGGTREFSAKELAENLSNASDSGNGKTVKTIGDTEIAKFLDDLSFRNALDDAIANDPAYSGATFNEVLDGKDASGNRVNNTSFWDDASKRLVEGHTGDYRLIMPELPGGSVAAATEIPALLEKAATTNGFSSS